MNTPRKPVTLASLARQRASGDKIVALTAYDAGFARLADAAGIEVLLIGDSLGMVIQGHDSTLPVTLEQMAYHTRCVARGNRHALLIADLPFGSYQGSPAQAFASSAELMRAGAHMVKLEGGAVMLDTVRFLSTRGVPVCAHLGLLPQSVNQLGGWRVQGRDDAGAAELHVDARNLQAAGASLLVLEAIPAALGSDLTAALEIPTIGIGAGAGTSGQVLVSPDLLGITPQAPRFAKNFLATSGSIDAALRAYVSDVKSGRFPAPEHSF
jgi:3-methyl-2-oxobutanoate hydroxymethyltransferase